MIRYSFLPLLLTAFCLPGNAQRKTHTFTLSGSINTKDTGTMLLMQVNDTAYYPYFHEALKTTVTNGKFTFSGPISYPCAFIIGFKPDSNFKYLGGTFFVEQGRQTIACNVDSMWETPAITNPSMDELRKYNLTQPDMAAYIIQHPNSYVALWELVKKIWGVNYNRQFDSCYAGFSATLKNSFTGKVLKRKLLGASLTCVGCTFPAAALFKREDLHKKVDFPRTPQNYTLVDFWFSHCSACIEQFPGFKELYHDYKNKGLELISISTDGKAQIRAWQAMIGQNKLPWPQYLDQDGSLANLLAINRYPTNFLLNDKGVIIRQNILPDDLRKLLAALP